MKKRLVSVALVAAMALSLVACGSKSSTDSKTNEKETQTASETSKAVDWSEYDALVEQIRTETDLAKRAELMHQAEDMLMDTWCIIPLYYYNDQYMLKDYVKGVYSTVEGMKYFYKATNSKNADELNIYMASEPDHIDPALNSTVDGGCLAVNSFEGLMRYNDKGELEPACAESYEVSEDGLTYTFKMREGLKWSNGDDLDATDFEYSWKRAANPETAADYSYLCAVFGGYDETKGLADDDVVASEDGKTLTVKLKAVTPYFLDLCAFPFFFPVDEEVVASNADWANDATENFVTNGAYTLKSWKHDSSMVYEKNPNYWDADSVSIKNLNVMLTSDDVTAYTAYQNGDLDFIDSVPTAEMEAAKKLTKEFYSIDNLGTYYAGFNINSKLYSDLGLDDEQAAVFRHAICLLIDRQYIIDTIAQCDQKIATTFIPEGVVDGNGGEFKNKDYYGTDYEANVEEAKQLLESIGLYDSSTGQLTQTVEFTYLTNNTEGNVKIGEAIQADLSAVGINLKIEQQEWNVFLNARKEGQFDFAREGWLMDYNDPINMLEMFTTNSGNNDMQFGR